MKGSILLVEDDELLCDVLSRHLTQRGYEVVVEPSAEAALERLGTGLHPALVLLDINLPGATGWDLLRAPELAGAGSPPVVIASATPVSPRKLREYGVAGYLPKPFPMETLRSTIERLTGAEEDPA